MIPSAKPEVNEETIARIVTLLRNGRLAQGAVVDEFRGALNMYLTQDEQIFVVPTSSGTAALHIALIAAGVKRDDVVIVPSFTFAATAAAVRMVGAVPFFVEIDPDTFGISPNALRELLSDDWIKRKTTAIIPVHMFGQAIHKQVFDIAAEFDVPIIEDACQAIGAQIGKQKVGTIGDYGVFSFYATKNVFCGEGGAVVTKDKTKARILRDLTNHGMSAKYYTSFVGYNYRMTDINAAIGLGSLERITANNLARKCNAYSYNQRLSVLQDMQHLKLPPHLLGMEKGNGSHVWHQYSITVLENRDGLLEHLRSLDIGAAVNYPYPLHQQPAFRRPQPKQALGYTEWLCDHILSLPVHPAVSAEDVNFVCDTIEAYYGIN